MKSSPNNPTKEIDYLIIGTSIIASFEACYLAQQGKSVLMIDRDSSIGGAWKTIELAGVSNIENAIHYFLPDEKGINFMKNHLNWPIETSVKKYRFFSFFGLICFKIHYDSSFGRFIHKLFFSRKTIGLQSFTNHLIECIKTTLQNRGIRSYYIAHGSAWMLDYVEKLIARNSVEIKLNTNISEIFIDTEKKEIICKTEKLKIISKSLVLGHGARLPELKSNLGVLKINEKFHSRPAFHLVIEDCKRADSFEIIMTSDSHIKYVHDVTRFSSLAKNMKNDKKIFVFALHHNIRDSEDLEAILHHKLKKIGQIEKESKIIESLYSHKILPTLDNNDLTKIEEFYGDNVNTLRTENFSSAFGFYSERWRSIEIPPLKS